MSEGCHLDQMGANPSKVSSTDSDALSKQVAQICTRDTSMNFIIDLSLSSCTATERMFSDPEIISDCKDVVRSAPRDTRSATRRIVPTTIVEELPARLSIRWTSSTNLFFSVKHIAVKGNGSAVSSADATIKLAVVKTCSASAGVAVTMITFGSHAGRDAFDRRAIPACIAARTSAGLQRSRSGCAITTWRC